MCLKELDRLIKHYSESKHAYDKGVVHGLKMAVTVIENKDYYKQP